MSMANNRLWAVCKLCNEAKVVMKYYPPGSFITGDSASWYINDSKIIDHFEDWVKTHDKHGKVEDFFEGSHIVFVTEYDEKVKSYDFSNYLVPKIYLK